MKRKLLPTLVKQGLLRLEPYTGKLVRTVLRGGWRSNTLSLPASEKGEQQKNNLRGVLGGKPDQPKLPSINTAIQTPAYSNTAKALDGVQTVKSELALKKEEQQHQAIVSNSGNVINNVTNNNGSGGGEIRLSPRNNDNSFWGLQNMSRIRDAGTMAY